jgi:hypothetical protein
MPDVYYVFGLKNNLMSIGQLLQKGCIIYMEDNYGQISKQSTYCINPDDK